MQPQMEKAETCFAFSFRFEPSAREITLAPPTPKRLEIAERNIKAGIQTVTAVIISSLPEKLTNRVSAIL